ncbi:TRAP transporter solute receptor, TAXI family precursor [Thioalkalivibrio nitratireducens DSM 14787]|uniref:TRAP transporter solute receptor, TAXI family n=1 Tax=Thioalkalivibrio nitratireducens (strain DSM 14787 / UNIQEM 213 / ALEN2) TaxID=1255043 RepID=L0E2X6_THIND|nr:TRAP transporter solute receptor, TAXI family precursor [Thioalkalivibrio nitratireducens DSM 14787]
MPGALTPGGNAVRRPFITAFTGLALVLGIGLGGVQEARSEQAQELRWATSAVGSAGHRAKVALMAMLNREMPDYSITVLPTPGALATVRGYAVGQFDGYYGADIAFGELAANEGRFRGFRDQVQREPVQSFWAYTMEVGLGVRTADRDRFGGWGDLEDRPVFTGPAPWDVRATLERAMNALDVGHRYVEVDLGLVASSLSGGAIDAFVIYSTGEASPAPWVIEALLSTDVAALNPSDDEIARLEAAGLEVVRVDAEAFQADLGVDEVVLAPFFYGFHVGLEVPEDDVYRMLTVIEAHADELARSDAAFRQIRDDMVEIQRRGVAASVDSVRVHPGLARYLREHDAWNEDWDDRIAGS